MIIIDEAAESKLVKMLEASHPNAEASRCIHFNFSAAQPMADSTAKVQNTLFTLAEHYISTSDIHFYLCADGDIFILAPIIQPKEARLFMVAVAEQFQLPPNEKFFALYDVSIDASKLLQLLEQKQKHYRALAEEKQRQHTEKSSLQRRQAILQSGTEHTRETIQAQRNNREKPELMIIEDDAFSRRLVANVLPKDYRLTALGTADTALPTYARLAPDMLFLDINIPDVSGHELLERIMVMDPDAYVVMLSGNADKANIMQAMSKGAKGFIAKPFNREKLLQYIEACPTIN
jgi:two-component system, chemotaxis family, chemotaxis protein CheY